MTKRQLIVQYLTLPSFDISFILLKTLRTYITILVRNSIRPTLPVALLPFPKVFNYLVTCTFSLGALALLRGRSLKALLVALKALSPRRASSQNSVGTSRPFYLISLRTCYRKKLCSHSLFVIGELVGFSDCAIVVCKVG